MSSRYYLIFLEEDGEVHSVLDFDGEEEWEEAIAEAEEEEAWPPELREWASFTTWERAE